MNSAMCTFRFFLGGTLMSTKVRNLNKISMFLSVILLFSTFFSVFSADYDPNTAQAAITFIHPGIYILKRIWIV